MIYDCTTYCTSNTYRQPTTNSDEHIQYTTYTMISPQYPIQIILYMYTKIGQNMSKYCQQISCFFQIIKSHLCAWYVHSYQCQPLWMTLMTECHWIVPSCWSRLWRSPHRWHCPVRSAQGLKESEIQDNVNIEILAFLECYYRILF